MKTIVLTGMSETDLSNQQWIWETSGAKKKIVKQWPDEHLPLRMRSPIPMQKILPTQDQLSGKIEHDEE
jgi:hypothetical protein